MEYGMRQPLKTIAQTVQNRVESVRYRTSPLEPLATSNLAGGMVTNLNPANLQLNQFVLAKNVRFFDDRMQRRDGSTLFTPAKPDSNKIMNFISFARNDGSVKLLRFTPSSIEAASATFWSSVTGDPLAGQDTDRFQVIVIDDRCFFTNNGVNVIQEINTNNNTYAPLGNAPEYRFITGFGDRIVGANRLGLTINPVEIGWSGNINYDEWDPLVDNTAGFTPLVDSPSDLSDFIQGVYSFSNVMVIPRERSVWEATKKGIASDPFQFTAKIPGVGTDAPWSITKIPGGLAWLDTRTRDVYIYGLDGSLTPIGEPIRDAIINTITDPKKVIGSYNQQRKELSLLLLNDNSNNVRVWTYSFIPKCWWYDEYVNLSFISDLDFLSSTITINDLVGTIDELVGTIDDLSPSTTTVTRFFGYENGDILVEDSSVDTDNNVAFPTELQSKTFTIPADDVYVAELRFEFVPKILGTVTIEYKCDNFPWRPVRSKTWTADQLGQNILFTYKRQLKARRYAFRIRSTTGQFEVVEYEVWVTASGDSRD